MEKEENYYFYYGQTCGKIVQEQSLNTDRESKYVSASMILNN